MAQVFFIGAGPGDPDLLTLKAKKLIEAADVIIYADSLVNPDICSFAGKDAVTHKSASLTLDETSKIIKEAVKQGKIVARVQSGDPSIYGAIAEQMTVLDDWGIEYEIIPGVSSLFAAAAALKVELTLPEISQTVIITRREGRTPVPDSENLRSLASHGATIALFLSIPQAESVVADLIQGGYDPATPAAVVYKASWEDQKVIRCRLEEMPKQIAQNGIKKQALILVGRALDDKRRPAHSKLYDPDFKHEYRK
jgi:precorrin-4/cobalt-precorrin-4 C11-methyltransferase